VTGKNPDAPLRIGTRGSRLALWQTEHVAAALRARNPAVCIEIVTISSHGDLHGSPVAALGQVGIFTREIEDALLDSAVDLAVHSLKDLPTESPRGLELAALLPRDDPRDVLVAQVLRRGGSRPADGRAALAALPGGARIATSSLRRRAELLRARPDLEVVELRGNVPTRLAKVERGEVDGVVLSRAGLLRLGLEPPGALPLEPEIMLPAPAQGTIAVQVRGDDGPVRALVAALDDAPTRICTTVERLLLHEMEGGCRVPLGALARLDGDVVTLRARLSSADGRTVLEAVEAGSSDDLARLAGRAAASLRARGGAAILAALRR
jgi:hydroxymethylbilane synthase